MPSAFGQASDVVKKPMTSMGSTANHFLRSHSGLEKIEENVMY